MKDKRIIVSEETFSSKKEATNASANYWLDDFENIIKKIEQAEIFKEV